MNLVVFNIFLLLICRYIGQVSDALAYCHDKNVWHRDIKPENILVDGLGNLKVDHLHEFTILIDPSLAC